MRKGLGHSQPFGKRKAQRRRVKRVVRRPRNMGYDEKMRAEQAGTPRTQRGKRPTVRPKPHTGPYTPEHHEGRNGQGKRVVPGSRAKNRPNRAGNEMGAY